MLVPDGIVIAPAVAPTVPKPSIPSVAVPENKLHVLLTREMWSDYFTVVMDNGQSEELDVESLREWFRVRGADMDKMEKVFDTAWNFKRAEVIINKPKEPPRNRLPFAPEI